MTSMEPLVTHAEDQTTSSSAKKSSFSKAEVWCIEKALCCEMDSSSLRWPSEGSPCRLARGWKGDSPLNFMCPGVSDSRECRFYIDW